MIVIFVLVLLVRTPFAVFSGRVSKPELGDGGITVVNNLNADVYAYSVSAVESPLRLIAAKGGEYHELWHKTTNGTGVSIKISTHCERQDILQFEYSAVYPTVYWDISCIDLRNDSTIIREGFSALPNVPGCEPVVCEPGAWNCSEVYHKPPDNHAVRGCPIDTSVVLKIGW
ncbi:hypothetical protein BDV59DRAFT_196832 [Aspergillus ambiguus]|uniref:uncharacterized protein n=1 Tax=Aspergillus ambiguus TaxID=176160 RepID=UPI003CCE1DAC